jgi:prophage maintenance system killer protein
MKNGFAVHATDEERFTAILSLAEGVISEEQFAKWLDDHSVKLP